MNRNANHRFQREIWRDLERNMAEGNEEQYFDLDKSFQELNIEGGLS